MPIKRRLKKVTRTERVFNGMAVRDAEQSILVQPTAEDIEGGVKGDPENCAFAKCVKRMLKTSTVFIYHTIAYVEVLGGDGRPVLERYMIKDGTREYLEDYDAKEEVAPAGFKLKAPNYANTLDYKASMRKLYRRDGSADRWEAARKAKARAGNKSTRRRVIAKKTVGSFRDGTGCVRFIGMAEGMLAKHEMGAD